MISPFLFWKRRKDDEPLQTELPLSDRNKMKESGTIEEKMKRANTSQKVERVNVGEEMNKPTNNSKTNMNITTEQIKELRDKTGISIMQCKKALEEAGGDAEKALVILRKKSGEFAVKKGDRTFKAGTIQAYIHSNGNVGTIVELDCESDFVSNNEEFIALARDIAMHITASNPKYLNMNEISETDRATALGVFEAEVKGKPEAVRKQILEGKLNAYFGEMALMNQPFIKNPGVTIQGLVDAASQKFGEKMAVGRFKRFKILEG
ncbi:MAG: elongation factor Ts [Patescibacteria group bacterium]